MAALRGRPAFASDDWMLEQQMRAEMEAEAWRRLRQEAAAPPEPEPAPVAPANQRYHNAGSTILKALVRFLMAAFAGYLAFLAGVDSGLGEFEVWLAVGAAFMVALALSMFGIARDFVHAAAEAMRWIILIVAGIGATWLAFNWPG